MDNQDYRTLIAIEKRKQELLDGQDVKIGKNTYHINSTIYKTKQSHKVYSVQQNDKQYAWLYWQDWDYEKTRKESGFIISYDYD